MAGQKDSVWRAVTDTLREFVLDEPQVPITGQTDPICQLGLASADGVDFTMEIEIRLGVKIDPKINLLVDDAHQRARRVEEIVQFIMDLMANQQKETAGD